MDSITGVLLIQLGTPDEPTTSACRRYLREFLSDPRVVDIAPLLRWMLVNLIIVPFRSPKSALAYQKIWQSDSPLRSHSLNLAAELQKKMGSKVVVELGMRYQNPSLSSALAKFKKAGVTQLIICPLYPQYASSSSGSSLEKVFALLSKESNFLPVKTIPAFFKQEFFIESFAQLGREHKAAEADHILFSFHGLPERQIYKSDTTGTHCLKTNNCCDLVDAPAFCYRQQCFQTARLIAKKLHLPPEQFSISFQSRLGVTPWIKPFTDQVLIELAQKGVKKLAVFCPSFVADCLETLEEIQIRGRESFKAQGGSDLQLIPSLNSYPLWVKGLGELISQY